MLRHSVFFIFFFIFIDGHAYLAVCLTVRKFLNRSVNTIKRPVPSDASEVDCVDPLILRIKRKLITVVATWVGSADGWWETARCQPLEEERRNRRGIKMKRELTFCLAHFAELPLDLKHYFRRRRDRRADVVFLIFPLSFKCAFSYIYVRINYTSPSVSLVFSLRFFTIRDVSNRHCLFSLISFRNYS